MDVQHKLRALPDSNLEFLLRGNYIHAMLKNSKSPLSMAKQWTEIFNTSIEFGYKKVLLESRVGLNAYWDILLFKERIVNHAKKGTTHIAIVCPTNYLRTYAFLGALVEKETDVIVKLFLDEQQAEEWLAV